MRVSKLARAFLWTLATLAVLAAFVVLDWFPTVKELGRLRRERSDLERKIKDYDGMADQFEFASEQENALMASNEAFRLRVLPQVEVDDTWLELARSDLRRRAKNIPCLMVFGEAEAFGPGSPGLTGWLKLQEREIRRSFRSADTGRNYPWHGVFPPAASGEDHLASRPLGVALEAPLQGLLDFVNRLSWGSVRLEIIHLRLEPAGTDAFGWLVCRGDYLARKSSAWSIKNEPQTRGNGPLVDPDSPLLWQKVDSSLAYRNEKKELAPPSGRNPE